MDLVARPLPPLVASLAAIGLAVLYLDYGAGVPVVTVGAAALLATVLHLVGTRRLRSTPYAAALLMESGLLMVPLAASAAGAALIVLAVNFKPADTAAASDREIFAALSVAFTSYIGSALIKPEGTLWNPVKTAVQIQFRSDFAGERDDDEKDARDAITFETPYGARHAGERVQGWGWHDRRLRTRQIQRAVDAGYLTQPPQPNR